MGFMTTSENPINRILGASVIYNRFFFVNMCVCVCVYFVCEMCVECVCACVCVCVCVCVRGCV